MAIRRIFHSANPTEISHAAAILVAACAGISPAWPTHAAAVASIQEYCAEPYVAFGMYEDETLLGWIGAMPQYGGHTWELHPLAVVPHRQRTGIGTRLVAALRDTLAQAGAQTLIVWCDDEAQTTTLGGKQLFPQPLQHLETLVSSERHAGGFYLRCGFALAGVIPDANGSGKHDFLYAIPLRMTS